MTTRELLQMPDSEYMNEAQLAYFRAELQKMRAEIINDIRITTDHLRETPRAADELDRAAREEEQSLEIRLREREATLLRKIDQAMKRIQDGTYGYCDVTGEPIGLRRLLARPTATLSIEAKQQAETRERSYRSP
ncbi:molecular chaperone DnaK [Ectothiorhodospira haloalkaliphila]|uniref:RNA polymerase-binding transcription factor DksA n=1 Tax=Ectothiorhodospira haloalkaliphila TaxID=421628 RepID=W8KFV7_9GAMM|nr:RNA polymerase-binding protein DksA [Ectothiorhodospira haloalkaliphila]AHK78629.1 molecular chaperone DnaK [Ectothiorhodospira haloalkaliphila]MCG5526279.1 RNA polymerase-binding protein DksA [Ectothiorhodospira haloalkaliphila]